mgnify:FL=1
MAFSVGVTRVPILRSEFFEGDSLFVSIGVLWYPPSGRQESSWLYWTQLSGNPYWKKGRSGKESNLTQPMNTISVFFLTCWWSNWEDQSPTHLETGKIPEGFSHSSLIFNYYYLIYSTHCQVFSQFFLPPKERILNLLSLFFLFSTFLVFSVRIQTHS